MTRDPRPVFLLGAPRSGTSLLYKALALHPDAAYISNWVHNVPGLPQLAFLDRLGRRLPERRHDAWFPAGNTYAPGETRGTVARLFPAPAEGEPVFARAGVTTGEVREVPPVDDELRRLRRSFASIRRWSGGDVLLVKRIANNRRIPLLRAAFPEARFVELVHDGRAVAVSLTTVDWWPAMRLWWLDTTPPEWVAEGGNEFALGAMHWAHEVDTIEERLAPVDASRRLRTRYEDLVDDPRSVLAEIARFAGLDPDDPVWSDELERMSFPNRNEKWRTVLGSGDLTAVETAAGDTLVRHGYTPAAGGQG